MESIDQQIAAERKRLDAGRPDYSGRVEWANERRQARYTKIAKDSLLYRHGRIIGRDEVDSGVDIHNPLELSQIARDLLSLAGQSIPATKAQCIDACKPFERSYSADTLNSILSNVANKALTTGYDRANEVWPYMVRQTETKDYRIFDRARMPDFPSPQAIPENGEVPRPVMGEGAREQSRLANHAFGIAISRAELLSDRLEALTVNAAAAGRACSRSVGDAFISLLTTNAALGDGVAWFHSSHGNIITSAAPSATTLAEARGLLASQTGPTSGTTNLNLRLELLLGAPELQTAFSVITGPFDNRPHPLAPAFNLQPAVLSDSRLTGTTKWFGFANPQVSEAAQVVFLEGGTQPRLEQKQTMKTDSLEMRVLHDFSVLATDFRPVCYSPGS